MFNPAQEIVEISLQSDHLLTLNLQQQKYRQILLRILALLILSL